MGVILMAGHPPTKTFSPKQRAQFIAALAASRATAEAVGSREGTDGPADEVDSDAESTD